MIVPLINYVVRFLEIICRLAISAMQYAEYFWQVNVWRGVNGERFSALAVLAYDVNRMVNVAGRHEADALIALSIMLPAYDENHFAFNAVTAN